MTALILVAALYLNFVLAMLGVPQALAGLIKSLDVSPLVLLWVLAVIYLILGIALETLPMLVGTRAGRVPARRQRPASTRSSSASSSC